MSMGVGSGDGPKSEINVTPLVDVVLVLLIIFMVTTAVTIESAAHVDLPKAEAAAQPNEKPKGVVVTLTADHQIMVNSTNVSLPQLQGSIKGELDKSADKIVIFQGDPKVILGDMVHILDIAKSAGAEAIAIAVSQLPPGGAAPSGGGGG